MHPDSPDRPPRPSVLPVILALVTLGGIALLVVMLFVVVFNPVFRFLLVCVLAAFGMGMFHYLLWGASLNRQTEGEREEERLKREMEEEKGW